MENSIFLAFTSTEALSSDSETLHLSPRSSNLTVQHSTPGSPLQSEFPLPRDSDPCVQNSAPGSPLQSESSPMAEVGSPAEVRSPDANEGFRDGERSDSLQSPVRSPDGNEGLEISNSFPGLQHSPRRFPASRASTASSEEDALVGNEGQNVGEISDSSSRSLYEILLQDLEGFHNHNFAERPAPEHSPSHESSSSSSSDLQNPIEEKDYFSLLKDLANDWLGIELNHHVSKSATDAFWSLALEKKFPLFETKQRQQVRRKTPQFQQMRNILSEKIPPIKMTMGFIHKETGELVVEENLHSTPLKMYGPAEYRKAYEIASVKVIIILRVFSTITFIFIFPLHFFFFTKYLRRTSVDMYVINRCVKVPLFSIKLNKIYFENANFNTYNLF